MKPMFIDNKKDPFPNIKCSYPHVSRSIETMAEGQSVPYINLDSSLLNQ